MEIHTRDNESCSTQQPQNVKRKKNKKQSKHVWHELWRISRACLCFVISYLWQPPWLTWWLKMIHSNIICYTFLRTLYKTFKHINRLSSHRKKECFITFKKIYGLSKSYMRNSARDPTLELSKTLLCFFKLKNKLSYYLKINYLIISIWTKDLKIKTSSVLKNTTFVEIACASSCNEMSSGSLTSSKFLSHLKRDISWGLGR